MMNSSSIQRLEISKHSYRDLFVSQGTLPFRNIDRFDPNRDSIRPYTVRVLKDTLENALVAYPEEKTISPRVIRQR